MGKTEKRQSIIVQDMSRCIICGKPHPHKHHVFGASNRKWSEQYGLTVPLCYEHHNGSDAGVHFDKRLDLTLKKMAQARFTETYPDKDFRTIFGRNYL